MQVNFWTDFTHRRTQSEVQIGAALSTSCCRGTRTCSPVWVTVGLGVLHDILAYALLGIQEVRCYVPRFLSKKRSPSRYGSSGTSSIGNVWEEDDGPLSRMTHKLTSVVKRRKIT